MSVFLLCYKSPALSALIPGVVSPPPPPRLYVNWRFMRGIEAQFLALQKGFNELIPQHLLKPFDQKELEVHVLSTWNCFVLCLIHNQALDFKNHTKT